MIIPVTVESIDGDATDRNDRALPARKEIVIYSRECTIDDAISEIEMALGRLIDPETSE
ncbi:hypothetical protein LCGC14_1832310 [marine sediment metagenome]|uniref:Uncharacterized protein n=1 Tax=marine sediment metagenome TaxID=412755 RepID=A0A0F9H3U3_9ZZZZ